MAAAPGRSATGPSRIQQRSPCAAAASWIAFSAAIWWLMRTSAQSGVPVRIMVAPAFASSWKACWPLGASASCGGGSDSPIGNTFWPSTSSTPVGP